MKSEGKNTRLQQKSLLEKRLQKRLSVLAEKGLNEKAIAKDVLVKKLRADLNRTERRLLAIEAVTKRTDELSKRKAEKPLIEQEKGSPAKKDAKEKPPETKAKKEPKPKKNPEQKSEKENKPADKT